MGTPALVVAHEECVGGFGGGVGDSG